MHNYSLSVVTPSGTAYDSSEVAFSKFPGTNGEIGVMPNHSAMISSLVPGVMMVRDVSGKERFFFISSGMVHVRPDAVSVMVPFIEQATDIDVERARASKKRAEDRLAGREEIDRDRARFALLRAEYRLYVALTS